MKYFSVDTETGGLSEHTHSLLEVGIMYDDTSLDRPYPWLRCLQLPYADSMNLSLYSAIQHGNIYRDMQAHINGTLKELHEVEVVDEWEYEVLKDGNPIGTLVIGPEHVCTMAFKSYLDIYQPEGRLNLAAKNAAFDLGFLRSNNYDTTRFRHRILDPGPMYVRHDDEKAPDLTECLNRADMNTTDLHTSIGDAHDVCRLIRNYFKVQNYVA